MNYFDHEKLDVYKIALQFVVTVEEFTKQFPRGRSYLVDQLQRASTSIPFNIAEGAGEWSENEKIRFYRIARRSATECASILDICFQLRIINEQQSQASRALLLRIVAMLTKLSLMKKKTGPSCGLASGLVHVHENKLLTSRLL